jgi:hypothetical protein
MVFGCKPEGSKRPRGRPRATFRHTYMHMLTKVQVTSLKGWWQEVYTVAQDREFWRAWVKSLVIPEHSTKASQRTTRAYLDRAGKRAKKRYVF